MSNVVTPETEVVVSSSLSNAFKEGLAGRSTTQKTGVGISFPEVYAVLGPTENSPIRFVLIDRVVSRLESLIQQNQLLSKDNVKPVLDIIVNELGNSLKLDCNYNPSREITAGSQDRSEVYSVYINTPEFKALIASSEDPSMLMTSLANFKIQAEKLMYEEMGNVVGEVVSNYFGYNFTGVVDSSVFAKSVIHQLVRSRDSIYALKLISRKLFESNSREQFVEKNVHMKTDTWLFRKVFEIKESLTSGRKIEVSKDVKKAILDMEETSLVYDINESKGKIEKLTGEIEKYDVNGEYFKDVLLVTFIDFIDDIDQRNASLVWSDEDRESPLSKLKNSPKMTEVVDRIRGNQNVARSLIRTLLNLYTPDNLDEDFIKKMRDVNLVLLFNTKGRSLLSNFMKERGYLEADYVDLNCGDLVDLIAVKMVDNSVLGSGLEFVKNENLIKAEMSREEIVKTLFKGVNLGDIDKMTGLTTTSRIVKDQDAIIERLLESREKQHNIILESENSLANVRRQKSEVFALLQ